MSQSYELEVKYRRLCDSMVTISFYKVQNNQGQQLLDQYVRPICNRLGVRLLEARPNADRGDSAASQFKDNFILWDCSVEDGHVYRAFNEWVKNTKKHIVVSRTPLPRNVLTFHQCAPIHSHKLSNAEIGHWLEPYLRGLLSGDSHALEAANDKNKVFASLYWRSEHPANVFLSFRGSQQEAAERWSKQFTRETKLTLRMVPKQLYAYETECVSRQQMWEGVAHLNYEIKATGKAAIFLSDDYFDSFWTCSELLSLIRWPRNIDGTTINGAYIMSDRSSTELHPLAIETPTLPVPNLTRKQANRFWRILNNSDPLTSGPDTRIPPSGPAKILAFILRPTLGYYDPEFTAESFWKTIRVPCPHCRPKKRLPSQINWDEHLAFDTQAKVDCFGFFAAQPEELSKGTIVCPNCQRRLKLENKRQPRTLWFPIQTTERDQHRPVIEEYPVWEVVN